jgi:hypothetical protein
MNAWNPLLAELGSIEKTVVTVLAVAGGFFLGFVLTGVLAGVLAKLAFKKAAPSRLVHFSKLGGGAIAAIAIYMLLSGEGGLGLGGRGGGDAANRDKGQLVALRKAPEDTKQESQSADQAERSGAIQARVLAADSPDGKFFQFMDEPDALTSKELINRIEAYDLEASPKPKYIELVKDGPEFSRTQSDKIHSDLVDRFEPRGMRIVSITDSKDAD